MFLEKPAALFPERMLETKQEASGLLRLLKNPLNFEGGSLFLISHGYADHFRSYGAIRQVITPESTYIPSNCVKKTIWGRIAVFSSLPRLH